MKHYRSKSQHTTLNTVVQELKICNTHEPTINNPPDQTYIWNCGYFLLIFQLLLRDKKNNINFSSLKGVHWIDKSEPKFRNNTEYSKWEENKADWLYNKAYSQKKKAKILSKPKAEKSKLG